MAKIIPLHKKEEKDVFENYRPISLLPVFSKVFEKVVYKQTYQYFISNQLLLSKQHGFRNHHSTETATIEFIDHVKLEIDKGHVPISILWT